MDAVADSSVMAHAVVMGPESGSSFGRTVSRSLKHSVRKRFVGDVVRGLACLRG